MHLFQTLDKENVTLREKIAVDGAAADAEFEKQSAELRRVKDSLLSPLEDVLEEGGAVL